ncbi:MAG: polysaccharide biosynthesis C-terminal domain-containing protein [Bacteroidales bacterium]|nr:polysaccharide biosynthesis C-terminal domain-containing protein [Bacteroidales bacterium]MDD3664433.1 polysaccharide biosynthesis C-terminal domain-containing protein [Bacteroidales bacterium]
MTKLPGRKRSLLHDIAGVFSGNVAAMVAVLLTNIVLSRTLGPANYGVYTSLLAVLLISVSIVQLGITRSAVFHLGQNPAQRPTVVHAVFNLWIITSVAGVFISLLAVAVLNNGNFTWPMVALALPVIPMILGNVYLGGVFLGLEEIRQSNRLYYLPATLTFLLSILMVWWLDWGVAGALGAALVSSSLVFGVTFFQLVKRFGWVFPAPGDMLVKVSRLGVMYAFTFMLLQLNYKADVLLLQKLRPAAEVGFYSLGVSVSEQLWLIPFAMGMVLMSRTANEANRELSARRTALLVKGGLALSIVGSVVLWFAVPVLIPLVFGSDFVASVGVVQAIVPGIVVFVVFRLLESHLAGLGKPWLALWALVPSLVINLGLNLWLIPRYGALGAAWATNISYSAATLVYILIYIRHTKSSIRHLFIPSATDWQQVFEMVKRFRKR